MSGLNNGLLFCFNKQYFALTTMRNLFSYYLKLLLFCCVACLPGAVAAKDYFDAVKKLPQQDKIIAANKIYNEQVAKLDSAAAVPVLMKLLDDAVADNDVTTRVLANDFLGRYCHEKERNQKSLQYMLDGLSLAEANEIKLLEADLTYRAGVVYYHLNKYPEAFEYILRANELIKEIGYENYPDVDHFFYDVAYIYYEFQEFKKSADFLHLANKYPSTDLQTRIVVNNTLALTYLNASNEDSAYYFFREAFAAAQKKNDTTWIGIISGNLGHILLIKKEYDKAHELIMQDYNISITHKQLRSAAGCLIMLGSIAMSNNDLATATRQLDSAKFLLSKDVDLIKYQHLYRTLAELSAKKKDMTAAYNYLDSSVFYKDSISRRSDAKMVAQVEGKIETEKHLAALKLVESERSRQVLLRNFVVVALVLIIVIVFQSLRRLRLKQKKDQQIFSIEKKRAEEEIRNAEKQLISYIESVREKSNLIEQFKEEIQRLQSSADNAGQPEQQEILEKLHYATILTEEDWTNFKNMFVKVHKDFFVRLKEKYPDLTQAETRFLSLTKLGFSVNEMANTLGISPDSVRKTRLRLRKKLNLAEHIILEDII